MIDDTSGLMSPRQCSEGICADLHSLFSYYWNTQIISAINQPRKCSPRGKQDGVLGLTEGKMKPGGVWRGVPLFVKSSNSKWGEFAGLMCSVTGCPSSHRERMRSANSIRGRSERGACLAVTSEVLWVTSCSPRFLATGDADQYLWKDAAWTLTLCFPQTRWESRTSCDLPARSSGPAKIPCAVFRL